MAVTTAALSPACVMTGGPGCGKTFATRAVVRYWVDRGLRVAMCAPTGRAAQRLTEIAGAPGLEASTIHRRARATWGGGDGVWGCRGWGLGVLGGVGLLGVGVEHAGLGSNPRPGSTVARH